MADYLQIIPVILGLAALILSVVFYKKSKDNSKSQLLAIIRSIISFNSHELSQYHFLALEYHKALKVEVTKEIKSENVLEDKIENLIEYLTNNLQRITKYNFKYLEKYFELRNEIKPRLSLSLFQDKDSLKVIVKMPVEQDTEDRYKIDQNTGFLKVFQTGTYFLCNDIARAVKTREYVNLNQEELAFNSSIVLPLVLTNNALAESFSNMFKIHQIERTMFGVLSVDHPKKNYFNEDDISVLAIVSELLTNYLVVYNMFTEFSETYHYALKNVNKKSANKGFQPTLINSRG